MPLPLLTARLAIRRYNPDDAAQVHEALYGDPDVMQWIGGTQSAAETAATVRTYAEDHERRGHAFWAVEERETGLLVGEAGLHPFGGQGPEIELGYMYGRQWWGKGFAREAATAILAFAFYERGLAEVVAVARDENTGSQAVLRTLGFAPDGRREVWGADQPFFRLRNPSESRRGGR